MAYTNLPGIWHKAQDGNIQILPVNSNPVVLVLGTAAQGTSDDLHRVQKVSDSVRTFGRDGNLVRGLYEITIAGAQNPNLYRIGATSAILANVGTGLTIETIDKDDAAGSAFEIFWDDSELRLHVWRVSDGELVYDNYPSYPDERVDLTEVSITGTATTGPGDIGTLVAPVTLAAANGVSGASYTAGTDGLNLSRMETYEALFNAYQNLEDADVDVVVPMNVYLDDLNVMDMATATITALQLTSLSNYPDAGATDDVLGRMYTEEYNGKNYFWWWFPANPVSLNSFSGAMIYPAGVGSATANTTTDGTTLTFSDFHEVNFAHQLADFCWVKSENSVDVTGSIGVLPPSSFAPQGMSNWVGKLPVYTTSGNYSVVSTNGTGLLGNKFMAGKKTAGGIPGLIVNGIEGLAYGGLIGTDDHFLDGTQQTDDNEHLIDIGKYLSVVATYPVLANSSQSTAYTATGAPSYGGFYSKLAANSAPTNKVMAFLRLPARLGNPKLDLLAGLRYVTFRQRLRGTVVSDAPTAARPDSDYQRLSTMRQVKATIDGLRAVAEPYLGEDLSGAQVAALDTALGKSLQLAVKNKLIKRYEYNLSITPAQRVLGQATLELKLVPAFELRQLTITVALAAV